jgi:hypothetical protein
MANSHIGEILASEEHYGEEEEAGVVEDDVEARKEWKDNGQLLQSSNLSSCGPNPLRRNPP